MTWHRNLSDQTGHVYLGCGYGTCAICAKNGYGSAPFTPPRRAPSSTNACSKKLRKNTFSIHRPSPHCFSFGTHGRIAHPALRSSASCPPSNPRKHRSHWIRQSCLHRSPAHSSASAPCVCARDWAWVRASDVASACSKVP